MLRIVSEEGTGAGTRFIDTETGKDVFDMLPIAFGATVTIGEMVTAQCTLLMPNLDIAAAKTDFVMAHPVTKSLAPVAAIEFRDGWRIEFMEDGMPRLRQQTPTGAL